jgi:hypothetical protein
MLQQQAQMHHHHQQQQHGVLSPADTAGSVGTGNAATPPQPPAAAAAASELAAAAVNSLMGDPIQQQLHSRGGLDATMLDLEVLPGLDPLSVENMIGTPTPAGNTGGPMS